MQIHWSFEKSANQARLTGYSPENGSGDSLSNDWTTLRDCVNQALTDELTGDYSETDATRLYSLVESAPDGPGEFWTPAASGLGSDDLCFVPYCRRNGEDWQYIEGGDWWASSIEAGLRIPEPIAEDGYEAKIEVWDESENVVAEAFFSISNGRMERI